MSFSVSTLMALCLFSVSLAFAEEVLPEISQRTRIFGKDLSIRARARILPSGKGIQNVLESAFLGQKTPLSSLSVEGDRTELYLRGVRVWSADLRSEDGLVYDGEVAPTRIDLPFLNYPIGPVLLQLSGGIEYSGNLHASLVPGDPAAALDTSVHAEVQGGLTASAFVEGSGSMMVVRGGVDGRVTLIEGNVGAQADLSLESGTPRLAYFGKANLLRGKIRGHLDTRLLLGRWNRVLTRTFFSWPGRCFSFGAETCLGP
jgi:hypothetical protein